MSTVVLYSKDDSIKYLSDRPSANKILPLTPNALAELIGKVDVEILDPLTCFSDCSQRRIMARVRSLEIKLYQKLQLVQNLEKKWIEKDS